MPENNSQTLTGDSRLSELIWRLKLQAERQLGVKESLRVLLSEPERLEQLLAMADEAGDDSLKRLVADIRLLRGTSVSRARIPQTPLTVLVIGGLIALVLAFAAWSQFGKKQNAAVAAVVPATLPVQTLFRMHGSNTIGEKLAPALAEAYLKHKGATATETQPLAAADERRVVGTVSGASSRPGIEVFAHGSATAFKDLAAGTTDLGMASRRIKPEELALLSATHGDLGAAGAENVVGLDGVAVIVNPSNPVSALNLDQIAGIFSGEIADWSQVGGSAGSIRILARDDKSGTYDTFKALVLEAHEKKLAASAQRIESSTELSDAVADTPNAIGFIGLPYVLRAKALAIAASADGRPVVPTAFTVGTEDYPLSRRLYLYLPSIGRNKDAADFVEFALSEAGQEVVKSIGFVSQNLHTEKLADDPALPADYRQLVEGAERLSLNFRFVAGGNELDTKGQRDLLRVVDYLSHNPGRAPILIGFADASGSAAANLALSLARAKAVEAALQERGVFAHDVRSFGSAVPVASNDTEAGREKNRRVEVWLK